MKELLTAAQMRAIEQAAIASGEVSGLELMERAGRGVVEAIFEEWPELSGEEGGAAPQAPRSVFKEMKRAVVLCGPGNNGGDGFVVARLLKERGWEVEVFLYGDAEKLPPDARVNYKRWHGLGQVAPVGDYLHKEWGCDLLVDALFGTGLKRGLAELGELFLDMEDMVDSAAIEFGHKAGRPAIVSIDVPSGICSDSGRVFPNEQHWYRFAACAHLTVSFHSHKLGHFLDDGPVCCGKTVVVDIGLKSSQVDFEWVRYAHSNSLEPKEKPWRLAKRDVVGLMGGLHSDWVRKDVDEHKFRHGHALIVSGGSGKSGAARLAARGALRIGTGLVTLAVPGSAQMEVACQITALMLTRADDAAGLAEVLGDARLNALCLGPGLGIERSRGLVPVALKAGRATVLDADALTAFEDTPDDFFGILHSNCVLTPHGGEFARLFPDIAARLNETPTKGPAFSKVDATRAAAARAGCTVLFKGADTVIADETGRCCVHAAVYDRAAPWLATAGSGDVLAGFITGLLARGFAPMMAAENGAWLHAECALQFGPGLIAEDLPEQLPAVLRSLDP